MDWNSDSKKFFYNTPQFALAAQVDDLKNGIVVEKNGQRCFKLFSIVDPQFSEVIDSTFRRGSDLFTIFQKANHSVECYWRLCQGPDEFILESIVSLRSSHLETEPCLFGLQSVADDGQLELKDDSTAIIQLDQGTLVFLVHPDDSNEVRFTNDKGTLHTRMSVPLLERGVMRRTRSRVCFFSSDPSDAEIEKAKAAFATSEIPLTT